MRTLEEDVAALKARLDEVVAAHPEVDVGSYPKWDEPRFRTEITFDGKDVDAVDAARQALLSRLAAADVVTLDPPSS